MTIYYADTITGSTHHVTSGRDRLTVYCGATIPVAQRPPVADMPTDDRPMCGRCGRRARQQLWREWRAALAAYDRDEEGSSEYEQRTYDALVDFIEAFDYNGCLEDPRGPM